MSLIETTRKLKEDEQKIPPPPWTLDMQFDPTDVLRSVKFTNKLRNVSRDIFEVLECFEKGDNNRLDILSIVVGAWTTVEKSRDSPKYKQWADIEDMITRLREAAKKMEE